jgi:NAD+ synthase
MEHTLFKDYERLYNGAVLCLRQYLRENKKLGSLILGVSGGIDSAVIAAIAKKAIESVPYIKLIGRSLPMSPTEPDEARRALAIGLNFCDDFSFYNLENAFKSLIPNIERKIERSNFEQQKIRMGNIRARIRMIQLYDIAHHNNGMVLSTDNLTEYYLGFWTLHGDVGDFGPLQNVWKTEVYGIAEYLYDQYGINGEVNKANAMLDCIDAVPTDGLGITVSDLIQIEADSYFEVDSILIDYLNGNTVNENHPVIKRHNNTHFKRENPVSIPREVLIETHWRL